MDADIPVDNCVGKLQEKCFGARLNQPEYVEGNHSGRIFIYHCRIKNITTEGRGINKKIAKQNAAKEMLQRAKTECLFDQISSTVKNLNAVSNLNMYSTNEKKASPLYGELPEEDGDFVYTCTFDGFTAKGRGSTKKIAKEKAAEAVFKHFDLFKYFQDKNKLKERQDSLKNPVSNLYEYCQIKKLNVSFSESTDNSDSKKCLYVFTCSVGDLQVESVGNVSKKLGKIDAATKMLQLLMNSPCSSPASPCSSTANDLRDVDNEPLVKRIKTDL